MFTGVLFASSLPEVLAVRDVGGGEGFMGDEEVGGDALPEEGLAVGEQVCEPAESFHGCSLALLRLLAGITGGIPFPYMREGYLIKSQTRSGWVVVCLRRTL